METKRCSECGRDLPANPEYFTYRDKKIGKFRGQCRSCFRAKRRPYEREWQRANYRKAYKQDYYERNRDHILSVNREWRAKNPELMREYSRKYHERERSTPKGALMNSVRALIWQSIKDDRESSGMLFSALPYTIEDLKEHLEAQFEPGMSWENYGEWHVDHKIPVSRFDFSDVTDPEFQECWALENLRPMWGRENQRKRDKTPEEYQEWLEAQSNG